MVKIAIDAMGSDNGSSIVVEAVKKFLNDYKDVQFTVYGKEEELQELNHSILHNILQLFQLIQLLQI